jgi:hypothetical protein
LQIKVQRLDNLKKSIEVKGDKLLACKIHRLHLIFYPEHLRLGFANFILPDTAWQQLMPALVCFFPDIFLVDKTRRSAELGMAGLVLRYNSIIDHPVFALLAV